MKQAITRRDVARAAGVSLTTVTHALNPPPDVRMASATRALVRRTARRLGYRPNFIGRALARRRNYAVGLLQPAHNVVFRKLYQGILFGLVQKMEPDDYHLLMLFRETQGWRRVLEQGRIDGLFILESDFETRHISEATATGVPVVVLNKDWPCQKGQAVGCVQADHGRMMDEAVSELCGLGRRFLAFVVDSSMIEANRQMLKGFDRAVAKHAGVVGFAVPPEQASKIWETYPACDGVITDGLGAADSALEAALAGGLVAGSDFHLIVATTAEKGARTVLRKEHALYHEQPELMGYSAWRVMKALIEGAVIDRVVKTPYVRCSAPDAREQGGKDAKKTMF